MIDVTADLFERNFLLDEDVTVQDYFKAHPKLHVLLSGMAPECIYVFKAMIALGQGHIFEGATIGEIRLLIDQLLQVEEYFADIGGIVGYQRKIEELLHGPKVEEGIVFEPPEGIDFTAPSSQRTEAIFWGLKELPKMAEIYPVGGAADRLKHVDKEGNRLPAAPLCFLGRSLLEGLIRDLAAREELYFQVFGKRVETPIVMMTSAINDNDSVIRKLLADDDYFGRDPDSFFFIEQPLVPSFDQKGKWVLESADKLLMKPGGHGVIWKLALEKGAFAWLKTKKRTKLLVRQINNPIAGTDCGLLAFMGMGHMHNKSFGFASCERLVGASEGVNVLKKRGNLSTISNIEYCDFAKFGIEDTPREKGDLYSLYPSNTNVLFADIEAVEKAALDNPYPGALVNFKEGNARLEVTMQNIADSFYSPHHEKTYMTFNSRRKTISTAKKEYVEGTPIAETPFGCFIDYQKNSEALLKECGFHIAEPVLFTYAPTLGPLYEIIKQKLLGGQLASGSELQIDLSDVVIDELSLTGSLIIQGKGTASINLQSVTVNNLGIDWDTPQNLWQNRAVHKESCVIILGNNSEFVADSVTFSGDTHIVVPDNTRMRASAIDGEVLLSKEPLSGTRWSYEFDKVHRLHMKRERKKTPTS